jgi:hypothetical protein
MSDDYEVTTTGISVVEGVEVDVTVRGDEDRAGMVLIDLKERLAVLAAAYDHQTPPADLPDDLGDLGERYKPPMSVVWDRTLADGNGVNDA